MGVDSSFFLNDDRNLLHLTNDTHLTKIQDEHNSFLLYHNQNCLIQRTMASLFLQVVHRDFGSIKRPMPLNRKTVPVPPDFYKYIHPPAPRGYITWVYIIKRAGTAGTGTLSTGYPQGKNRGKKGLLIMNDK